MLGDVAETLFVHPPVFRPDSHTVYFPFMSLYRLCFAPGSADWALVLDPSSPQSIWSVITYCT